MPPSAADVTGPAATIEHEGEPYRWVGYHGTTIAGAASICHGIRDVGSDRRQLGRGFYTTPHNIVAVNYALMAAMLAGDTDAGEIVNIYVRERAWQQMHGLTVPDTRWWRWYDRRWNITYDYLTSEIDTWVGAQQTKFNVHTFPDLVAR